MKILAVSDAVVPALSSSAGLKALPPVKAILSCGDLPPEYLSVLATTLDVPLFFVRGNHDIRYAGAPPVGGTDIDLRIVRLGGVNILGIEGSRWYNGGPCQYTEAEMRWRLIKRLPALWWRGADVVVAHAPPRFVQDAEDPCHRGFRVYRRLIARHRPRLFLHGHIHRRFDSFAERVTRIGGTEVINCYGYVIIDISAQTLADASDKGA